MMSGRFSWANNSEKPLQPVLLLPANQISLLPNWQGFWEKLEQCRHTGKPIPDRQQFQLLWLQCFAVNYDCWPWLSAHPRQPGFDLDAEDLPAYWVGHDQLAAIDRPLPREQLQAIAWLGVAVAAGCANCVAFLAALDQWGRPGLEIIGNH